MITKLILILYISLSCILIILILTSKGKGSEIGATFGNNQELLFGTRGANPLINKLIIIFSILILITTIIVSSSLKKIKYKNNIQINQESIIDKRVK